VPLSAVGSGGFSLLGNLVFGGLSYAFKGCRGMPLAMVLWPFRFGCGTGAVGIWTGNKGLVLGKP
jgi:hypothetical protein